MDFLKSTLTSALSKGPPFPYTFNEKIVSNYSHGVFTLFNGTKRDDGSACSIFSFEATTPTLVRVMPLAKNALRKLRTLRHPGVVRVLESVEVSAFC
jgi:SCY1-like protein 1